MVSKALSAGQAAEQGRRGRVRWHGVTAKAPCQLAGDLGGMLSVIFLPVKQTPPPGWVPEAQVFTESPACHLSCHLYSFPASYQELNYRKEMEPQIRAAGTSSNNVAIWRFVVL